MLFVAGAGGHIEQARRVLARLDVPASRHAAVVLLTDHDRSAPAPFDKVHTIASPAPKHRPSAWGDRAAYVRDCLRFFRLASGRYRVRVVIVTGPGFAFVPSLFYKLLGARLIVFESWSRFERRSKCSVALYRLADEFYVQHEEVLELYPKATWTGLL